jgi:hypothetical protein
MRITIRYSSIDGYSETRHYQTLTGAHRWADEMLGDCFEIGTGYAISGDGIGKIQSNISLEELLAKPKPNDGKLCLCGKYHPDFDTWSEKKDCDCLPEERYWHGEHRMREFIKLYSSESCSVLCTCQITGVQWACGGFACGLDMLDQMACEANFQRHYPGIL